MYKEYNKYNLYNESTNKIVSKKSVPNYKKMINLFQEYGYSIKKCYAEPEEIKLIFKDGTAMVFYEHGFSRVNFVNKEDMKLINQDFSYILKLRESYNDIFQIELLTGKMTPEKLEKLFPKNLTTEQKLYYKLAKNN